MITNSLLIAASIGASGNRVFVIGGEYRSESEQNIGALAMEQIARFNAEHAVVTIGALSADGAFDFSIEEAEITRAMIARTRYLTVIADSSKMGKRALFQVFPLERMRIKYRGIGQRIGGVSGSALFAPEIHFIGGFGKYATFFRGAVIVLSLVIASQIERRILRRPRHLRRGAGFIDAADRRLEGVVGGLAPGDQRVEFGAVKLAPLLAALSRRAVCRAIELLRQGQLRLLVLRDHRAAVKHEHAEQR